MHKKFTLVQIRQYKAKDHGPCISLFKSNAPLYFDPSELLLLENWLIARDEGKTAYPNNLAEHFYVLELNQEVIACGGFYIPPTARLNMVWGMVAAQHHKKGFGKKLLLYRLNLARDLYPNHEVILDTSQHTFGFFQKLGFSVTEIIKNGYGADLHRYDMILRPEINI